MTPLRIVIVAKAPQAGKAKTRLIPALGADGAAALAQRMLLHTCTEALQAAQGPVELCASPAPCDPAWRQTALPARIEWSEQGEGDLGMRMARAAQRVCGAGEALLLIGTDCPAVDAALLRRAAAALEHADATLVPTADGGYALLGMKRFDASLFENIAWSTDSVAAETLRRLDRLGWRVHMHGVQHDIDEPDDLRHLPSAWV